MFFLQNESLLYIFKCKWNRETRHLLKVLTDCSNEQNLKKLKEAISLSVHKRNILVIADKIVLVTINFSKALVILAWFLLLFLLLFLLIAYISLAFHLEVFQSELFRIYIVWIYEHLVFPQSIFNKWFANQWYIV